MIILGGGLIKHHICNANLMRNGADFSLFVNTASEFDGSDSGARWDYKYFQKPDKKQLNLCRSGLTRRSPGERSERTQLLWKCTPRSASFFLSLWLRLLQRGIIRNKLKVFSHPHTLGHNYKAQNKSGISLVWRVFLSAFWGLGLIKTRTMTFCEMILQTGVEGVSRIQ